MDARDENKMPILFQMAISSDYDALKAFLDMNDKEQDRIVSASREIKGVREMKTFVSSIGYVKEKW